eukprot:jgi/Picre1/31784/NNA_007134.t1
MDMDKNSLEALKAYVTAPGSQQQAASTVRLLVTHSNLKARFMEIRLDKHMTLGAENKATDTLWDVCWLGYYSPEDGCILHVEDTDPMSLAAQGWLEDVSKVEKYVMSDADYDARENTYRQFKKEKLKEDPTWTLEKEIAKRRGVPYTEKTGGEEFDDEYQAEEASHIVEGERCEVMTQEGSKRGVIRYVGGVMGCRKDIGLG